MGRLLVLEPFDPPIAAATEPAPSADWVAGHAAGLSEAAAINDARQSVLRDDVGQALIDLGFTYAEARNQVLASLKPLFTVIMDRLVPDLARQMLIPQIVDQLMAAAKADSTAPMQIMVNPSALPGLAASLPEGMPLPFVLAANPAIEVGQVLVTHRAQETLLDAAGLSAGIRSILAALFDETEGMKQHG